MNKEDLKPMADIDFSDEKKTVIILKPKWFGITAKEDGEKNVDWEDSYEDKEKIWLDEAVEIKEIEPKSYFEKKEYEFTGNLNGEETTIKCNIYISTLEKLQEIADRLNGDEKIDWERLNTEKYSIGYDYSSKKLICPINFAQRFVDTYCLKSNFLETAIKEIGEDVIKRDLFGIETPEKEYTMKEWLFDDSIVVGSKCKLNGIILSKGLHKINVGGATFPYKKLLEHQNEKVTIIGEK